MITITCIGLMTLARITLPPAKNHDDALVGSIMCSIGILSFSAIWPFTLPVIGVAMLIYKPHCIS